MSGVNQTLQYEPQGISEKMIGWARNLCQIQCTYPSRGVCGTLIFRQADYRLEADLFHNGLFSIDQDAPDSVNYPGQQFLQYWGELLSEDAPYLFGRHNRETFAVDTEVGTRRAQFEESENVGK